MGKADTARSARVAAGLELPFACRNSPYITDNLLLCPACGDILAESLAPDHLRACLAKQQQYRCTRCGDVFPEAVIKVHQCEGVSS